VLEVQNDASLSDIKRAYRKKALQFHPDKCPDPRAGEKFKEINQAFHVLSDLDKRRCYDSFGGVERPEIPITLTKPFEEFCEGIALGAFSILANMGFMALFGVPYGMSATGWLLASQLITAWQMVPSLEEVKDLSKWSKSLGAILSPVFLITSVSCVAGYLVFNGGRFALEYTSTKLGEIGEQIKSGVKALQSKEKLSIALDDWVDLGENDKKKLKETKIPDLRSEKAMDVPLLELNVDDFVSISSDSLSSMDSTVPSSSSSTSTQDDWLLVDDVL